MTGKNNSSDNALLYTLGIGSLGSVIGMVLLGGAGFPIGMIVGGVAASLVLFR